MTNQSLRDGITIGEKYRPAMEMHNEDEAAAYFELCVEHNMRVSATEGAPNGRAEAERIERINLGYFAGYYNNETRERVERLFHCAHPIFGAIAENGPPTAEEAFNAGKRMASS